MSTNETEWMRVCRANVLVKTTDVGMEVVLDHIIPWVETPLHVCDLPGPTTFPMQTGGGFLLRDVAALSVEQQGMLMDWLDVNAGNVQVISATARDLFAAVERGTFSGRLYYRLNTILAEIGVTGELQPGTV